MIYAEQEVKEIGRPEHLVENLTLINNFNYSCLLFNPQL